MKQHNDDLFASFTRASRGLFFWAIVINIFGLIALIAAIVLTVYLVDYLVL